MRGRLNLFQMSMLRWREPYPYNAVHVVRIGQPLSGAGLQQAIDDVLTRFGLTGLELDIARGRFDYGGGAANAPVQILPPGPDPAETLRAEIERQLNAPFPREGRIDPFRFFAIDGGDGFELGLGYDHFIAAGDSIVALLKAIADRYGGAAAPAGAAVTPDLYPPTYRRLLLRQLLPMLVGWRRLPANLRSFRHAFRPRYPHGEAIGIGFRHFRVDRHRVDALRRTAKAWGVTRNDLLLALLLHTLSPLAEARRRERRRNELAVASIVNIRGDCGPAARGAFGQFLSSFLVSHAVPPGATVEQVAREVGVVTARIKREKLYLQTLFALSVGGLMWRFMSPERRARFHAKSYPVWAGMSPLHVDALWEPGAGAAPAPEYIRAVPTGPLVPLVIALTTAAGALDIGLSFRTAAFSRAEIDKMAVSLLERIDGLC